MSRTLQEGGDKSTIWPALQERRLKRINSGALQKEEGMEVDNEVGMEVVLRERTTGGPSKGSICLIFPSLVIT